MRKRLIAVLLCILVTVAVVAYVITEWPLPKPRTLEVGIFYYTWYDPSSEESWNRTKIIDQPFSGFYNSCDPTVIRQHFAWMSELRIDFVMISWWGFYDDYGKFTDNTVKQMFKIAHEDSTDLKLAVMVEPFHKTGNYNYSEIYDHIYNTFVSPYSTVYYQTESKPVICYYNNDSLTAKGRVQSDNRFSVILVGHEDYVDWIYTDLDYYVKPKNVPHSNQMSVTPRFDDRRARSPSCTVDVDLSQGIYDEEWENATRLWREGKIDIITIASWNEYPERTAIEPHYDASAYDSDPYFLYNKTRAYINGLKGLSTDYVEHILETIGDLGENQCRYNAVDSLNCRLDTIKIIENPNGGYLGVYHSYIDNVSQVRLATSTDLLHWLFTGTIEHNASQPTIAMAPTKAFIVAFEKHLDGNHSLGFHYYSNLTSLLELTPELNFTVTHTLGDSSGLEGTPNFYNVTIKEPGLLSACVGFHFNNGTKDSLGWDRVAVGFLNFSVNSPSNQSWEVRPMEQHNRELEQMGVKGHIGDRDYGQIFGRNFTIQEACLLPPQQEAWSSWRVFLYDHSQGSFEILTISNRFNATSFGNPTFTFLEKSPNSKPCIVVSYFLFNEGFADEYKDKSGELIFYKEL